MSLFVGGAEIKGAADIAKASEAESLLGKAGVFARALGESSAENVKNLVTFPARLPEVLENTSAFVTNGLGNVKNLLAAARETAGNVGTIFEDSKGYTEKSSILGREMVTPDGFRMNFSEDTSRLDLGQTARNFGSGIKDDFGKNLGDIKNSNNLRLQDGDTFRLD